MWRTRPQSVNMWRGLSVLEPSQEVREAFLHGSQAPFLLLALGTCFLADQARVGACSLRGQLDLPQTVCQSCKLLFPPPNDHIHIAGCDRGGGIGSSLSGSSSLKTTSLSTWSSMVNHFLLKFNSHFLLKFNSHFLLKFNSHFLLKFNRY